MHWSLSLLTLLWLAQPRCARGVARTALCATSTERARNPLPMRGIPSSLSPRLTGSYRCTAQLRTETVRGVTGETRTFTRNRTCPDASHVPELGHT